MDVTTTTTTNGIVSHVLDTKQKLPKIFKSMGFISFETIPFDDIPTHITSSNSNDDQENTLTKEIRLLRGIGSPYFINLDNELTRKHLLDPEYMASLTGLCISLKSTCSPQYLAILTCLQDVLEILYANALQNLTQSIRHQIDYLERVGMINKNEIGDLTNESISSLMNLFTGFETANVSKHTTSVSCLYNDLKILRSCSNQHTRNNNTIPTQNYRELIKNCKIKLLNVLNNFKVPMVQKQFIFYLYVTLLEREQLVGDNDYENSLKCNDICSDYDTDSVRSANFTNKKHSDDVFEKTINSMSKEFEVVKSMMTKRGCTNLNGSDITNVTHGVRYLSPNGKAVDVYVFLKTPDMKTSIHELEDVDYAIVIIARFTSPNDNMKMKEILSKNKLEIWSRNQLQFDISEHIYQPKKVCVYKGNMQGVSHNSLPEIGASDPLVRFYRFPAGSILLFEHPIDGQPSLLYVKKH